MSATAPITPTEVSVAENAREAVLAALEVALDFPDQTGPVHWELSIQQFWMALYEEGFEVVPRPDHSDGQA